MYNALLRQWCEYLLSRQRADGGFDCEACDTVHGRADNAVFPFVYMYAKTGDGRFADAVRGLLRFRKLLSHSDGSVQNDFNTDWKGITAFSAIGFFNALHYFGGVLPVDIKKELESRLSGAGEWVYRNIKEGFKANINYYAAACAVNAMCGEYFGKAEYTARSRELLSYCLSCFTENGLISGEGQPHKFRTEKGCAPIDIGYYFEESLPCLVSAAHILGDGAALEKLTAYAKMLLEFLLPDGGLDNSFGSRSNKWTYYGSRTSDGCLAAFALLGKKDPVFYEAAKRQLALLKKCTAEGALYGGPQYKAAGQKPCIHHTFCHAAALAGALCIGIPSDLPSAALPCDGNELFYKYYPELDTYRIHAGAFIATLTAYDYKTYTYKNGAAHCSGGTLSLLYKKDTGPVIAGSVYEYRLTEINNMQKPVGSIAHRSLAMRAEAELDGEFFATCLDGGAKITVSEGGGRLIFRVRSRFVNTDGAYFCENDGFFADFTYEFSQNGVKISIQPSERSGSAGFILPVVKSSVEIKTANPYKKTDIFFLTGGFCADEYEFTLDEDIIIEIK